MGKISPNKNLICSEMWSCSTLDDQIREIIYFIQRLMQAAECYNKELNKEHNISIPQLNCLMTLYENGPLPLNVIAQSILVNSSTVTGIIDRLEEKGMANRKRVSPDRRVITVALTEDGRMLAQNAPPPLQTKIVAGLKKLPSPGREQIVDALSKLTHMLDVDDQE